MPCMTSDGMSSSNIVYRNGIHPDTYNKTELERKFLESALCAVFNELDRLGLLGYVLVEASEKGKLDLASFWQKHLGEDKSRLLNILSSMSKDERDYLKFILCSEEGK